MSQGFIQVPAPALRQSEQCLKPAIIRCERSSFLKVFESSIELLFPKLQDGEISPSRRLARSNFGRLLQAIVSPNVFARLQPGQAEIERGAKFSVFRRIRLDEPGIMATRRYAQNYSDESGN